MPSTLYEVLDSIPVYLEDLDDATADTAAHQWSIENDAFTPSIAELETASNPLADPWNC